MPDFASFADFPARLYLEKYYSRVGLENAALMRAAARSVRSAGRLGVVVELGGGPSLCALLAMVAATEDGPTQVIWADIASSSMQEVEDWLGGASGAFDYDAVFAWLEDEFDVDASSLTSRLRDAHWDIRRLDLFRPLPTELRGVGDIVGSHFLAEAATANEDRFVEMTSRVGQAASTEALIALSYIRHSHPYRLGDEEALYPAFSVDEDNLPRLLERAGLEFAELRIERGLIDDPPARPDYDGMVFATGRLVSLESPTAVPGW